MGYWRAPRTTGERRANVGSPIPVRGRRLNLPDTYDDISRKPYTWRSWKKYRKTQAKTP